MHIPDGFLSAPVWAALDAAAIPTVGLLARRAQKQVEDARIPLLGVMGAFVFAAQTVNFPIGLGTSGHLVGGALLAVTLGPAAASVVMTAILAIQAFLFQDGGVIALGANVLNMAVAGVLAGYLPYYFWGAARRNLAIFLGGTFSVLASAGLAMAQLLLSGVKMPAGIVWISLALFAVTACLEGAITVAVIRAIERLNPAWIRTPDHGARPAWVALATVSVLLVTVGVLFASAAPDALEQMAEQLGIAAQAKAFLAAPLHLPEGSWISRAGAGLAGLALIYGACILFGRMAARPSRSA
jgi:cobalt/nickel transport system permease protein